MAFAWAFFVVLLLFCFLCGATGVPGTACCVRPGCSVCPWAAAHPPSTAHDLPSSVWPLCVPVGGGPPARSPHASLTARSGRSRGPPWPCRHPPAPQPGPATAHGHRSLAHPSSEPSHAKPLLGPRPSHPALTPPFLHPHPISHAIPPTLFQTLNLDRWNCNVFRLC